MEFEEGIMIKFTVIRIFNIKVIRKTNHHLNYQIIATSKKYIKFQA
jgi:hypothetical protein